MQISDSAWKQLFHWVQQSFLGFSHLSALWEQHASICWREVRLPMRTTPIDDDRSGPIDVVILVSCCILSWSGVTDTMRKFLPAGCLCPGSFHHLLPLLPPLVRRLDTRKCNRKMWLGDIKKRALMHVTTSALRWKGPAGGFSSNGAVGQTRCFSGGEDLEHCPSGWSRGFYSLNIFFYFMLHGDPSRIHGFIFFIHLPASSDFRPRRTTVYLNNVSVFISDEEAV